MSKNKSEQKHKPPKYPKGFLWGASTAGHQVEGHCQDQWSRWEKQNAKRLAQTAQQRLNWLPNFKENVQAAASDPNNYLSGAGVDHFNKYQQDFKRIVDLELNSFRFTIEWSRVEPSEGVFDQKAIQHYQNYVTELKELGIEPIVNLWHWTHPVWFEDKGAFTRRKNIKYFLRFVKKLRPILEDVDWVVTINEPNNVVWFQYVAGEWPPAEKNKFFKAIYTYFNLIKAHKKTYRLIKNIKPSIKVTTAHSGSINKPKNPKSLWQRLAAKWMNYFGNIWYMRRIRNYQDVIGYNFYFTNYVKGFRPVVDFDNPPEPLSDLGWYMEPFSILELIRLLNRKFPGTPQIILESGLADRQDRQRSWWLQQTFEALDQATREDLLIVGYLHWSLLDNFEWAYGWWPAFGLIEVDREHNMRRKARASARDYQKLISDRQ